MNKATISKKVCGDPIFQALNPDGKQFIRAQEISRPMNPLERYGIKMYALTLSMFPHLKTIPTFKMMYEDLVAGRYEGKHTIVVDSSGNTAHAVVLLARPFGFREAKIVMSTDVPSSKVEILAAFGWPQITLVDSKKVTPLAQEWGKLEGHYHLNQYSHLGNLRAHEEFTGPEIHRVTGKLDLAVLSVAVGSGGTIGGIRKYYKENDPRVTIISAHPTLGQQVPGARDEARTKAVSTLPYTSPGDVVVTVSRKESFIASRQLSSYMQPQVGPTSGLTQRALEQYVTLGLDEAGRKKLQGKSVAFLCPDDGRFYTERMTAELDTDQGILKNQ